MNKKSKIVSFIMCIVLFMSFGLTINVQAETDENYKIISNCEVTAKQAKKWAKSKGATDTFVDLADLYWKYCEDHGDVNPGIAYVQAAKETGYGKFGGVINETYHNPCGLKTSEGGGDYDASAHQVFDSWDEGVQAHLDHLALYAGAEGYPRSNTYDPRHFLTRKGICTTTNELGGPNKWCPNVTYGNDVSKLYSSLLVSAGLKEETVNKDNDKNNANNNDNNKEENKKVIPKAESVKTSANNEVNITSNVGWREESGYWYYYNSDKSLATGWINPDGNWYYLNSSGDMATGWILLGQTYYYLNENGVMATGWKLLNGKYYYLQADGSMVTGLRNIDGKIYFLSNNGDMLTGEQSIGGTSYYFNSDGSLNTDKLTTQEDKKNDNNSVNNNQTNNSQNNNTNNKKVIVVDPGHARGVDSGTQANNCYETELDMQVALKLQSKLESLGYKVILTRTEDQRFATKPESLYHRVDVANDNNADFFISIHHNSVDDIPTAHGVETYYSIAAQEEKYGGKRDEARIERSKKLAKEICDNICEKLNATNRGAKSDNESQHTSLCVLQNPTMPAVLVEVGFLTNPEEAARCADSASQQLVVDAIAEVINKNI